MPGLLRARTRAPTSPTSQTRAERDGDEWVDRPARRCGRRSRTGRSGASCSRRTEPRRAAAQGHLVPARADGPARHRDPARSCRSPARRSSTRCSSTARAPRPTTSSARSTAAGRSRWARSRSSGARRRSASSSRSSSELARDRRVARASGGSPTTRSCANGSPTRGSTLRDHALQRAAQRSPRWSTATVTRGDVDPQALLGARCTAASASSRWTCSGPWSRDRRRRSRTT